MSFPRISKDIPGAIQDLYILMPVGDGVQEHGSGCHWRYHDVISVGEKAWILCGAWQPQHAYTNPLKVWQLVIQ